MSSFSFSKGDFTGEGNPLNDGNGHGTHVAGTTAGRTYGVSYCSTTIGCKLCAIKVLTAGGSGTWGGVAAGIDKVATDCLNLGGNAF